MTKVQIVKKKYCLFRSETLRMEIHVGFDTILLYKNPSCFWLPEELLLSVSTISGTIIANQKHFSPIKYQVIISV